MKRLINAAVLTLAIAFFHSSAYGYTNTKNESFPYIAGAAQFPPTKTRMVRDSFKLQVPKNSKPLSELTITIPYGLNVSNDISLSDQYDKKVDANITVDNKTITIAFPQYVAPGTELNIDLNHVFISGTSNGWIYPVSVRLAGLNANIPIGVFRLRLFS